MVLLALSDSITPLTLPELSVATGGTVSHLAIVMRRLGARSLIRRIGGGASMECALTPEVIAGDPTLTIRSLLWSGRKGISTDEIVTRSGVPFDDAVEILGDLDHRTFKSMYGGEWFVTCGPSGRGRHLVHASDQIGGTTMTPPTTYANHLAIHMVLDATDEIQSAVRRVPRTTHAPQSAADKRRGQPSAEHTALPILIVLARHANKQDECWLSFATMRRSPYGVDGRSSTPYHSSLKLV